MKTKPRARRAAKWATATGADLVAAVPADPAEAADSGASADLLPQDVPARARRHPARPLPRLRLPQMQHLL